MGNVDSISPFGSLLEYLPQFFQRYHPGLLQYKIPVDITIFGRVLKPELKGRFKGEIFENFHTSTVQ